MPKSFSVFEILTHWPFFLTQAVYRMIKKKRRAATSQEPVEVERRGRYRWKALSFNKLPKKFH